MDSPNKFQKTKWPPKTKLSPKKKWPLNIKLSITISFFELQSPDFAWKFVWTVQTKVQKVEKSTKVLITQPFFELQDPDFAWKFIWTVI